jgi:hypothetical protein
LLRGRAFPLDVGAVLRGRALPFLFRAEQNLERRRFVFRIALSPQPVAVERGRQDVEHDALGHLAFGQVPHIEALLDVHAREPLRELEPVVDDGAGVGFQVGAADVVVDERAFDRAERRLVDRLEARLRVRVHGRGRGHLVVTFVNQELLHGGVVDRADTLEGHRLLER